MSARRTPPPEAAQSSDSPAAPGLPRPPRRVRAPHRAEKRREVSPLRAPAQVGGRGRRPGAPAAGQGPGLPAGPGWGAPPASPARAPAPRAGRRAPRPPAELLPAPLPAARPARPLPAERRGACCFLLGMLLGPRSRRLSRRRSSRGAGTRGPGRGRNSAARPTLASSPRAPGSGRAAVCGAPLAWTAAPGAAQEAAAARAASRPPGCGRSARGLGAEPGVIPGAGRGRSGGRSEGRPAARAPCCRLPAAAVLLAGAPPGAAAGAALRLPPRAESLRAQLSLRLAPGGAGVAASVFSARVVACSLCAGEADPGCPFPPRT